MPWCPAMTKRFMHNTTVIVEIKGSGAMRPDGWRITQQDQTKTLAATFTSKSYLHLQLPCPRRSMDLFYTGEDRISDHIWSVCSNPCKPQMISRRSINCWESASYCPWWETTTWNNSDWRDAAWWGCHRKKLVNLCFASWQKPKLRTSLLWLS